MPIRLLVTSWLCAVTAGAAGPVFVQTAPGHWAAAAFGARLELSPEGVVAGGVRMRFAAEPRSPRCATPDERNPACDRVVYRHLWPGVDVEFYFRGGIPEYDFVLAPGARLEPIEIHFEGAQEAALDVRGDLWVRAGTSRLRSPRPVGWTESKGGRRFLASTFVRRGQRAFGVHVPEWDGQTHLRIDPELLLSTFADPGGTSGLPETGFPDVFRGQALYAPGALLVDADDSVLIGGSGQYASVVRLGARQSILVGFDADVTAMAADPRGGYVVAASSSPSLFASRGFLLKVRRDLTLEWRTNFENAVPMAVAVDGAGRVYAAGVTDKQQPYTTGAYRSPALNQPSGLDTVVLRLSPAGSIQWAALLGGNAHDFPVALAVDSRGAVLVAGSTSSQNFALPPGGYQTVSRGTGYNETDGFVVRLDPEGARLEAGTFLGGRRQDEVCAMVLLENGEVLLAGAGSSADFPGLEVPHEYGELGYFYPTFGFVTRVAPNLGSLRWMKHLPGVPLVDAQYSAERGSLFAVTPAPPLAGGTEDALFGPDHPVSGRTGPSLLEIDAAKGQVLLWSGVGGTHRNIPRVAVGRRGLVAISGTTLVDAFPQVGFPISLSGSSTYPVAQVMRFGDTTPVPDTVTAEGLTPNSAPAEGAIRLTASSRPLRVTAFRTPPAWLQLSGTPTGTPGQLNWRAFPAGLAPGLVEGVSLLTVEGGTAAPATLRFRALVNRLTASPGTLEARIGRGLRAPALPLRVGVNFGVVFEAASTQDWIRVSDRYGVAPSEISIELLTETLDPGTHRGEIVLTPSRAAADALKVPVSVTVLP